MNNNFLRTALNSWVKLTDEQWTAVSAVFRPKQFADRAFLALPGDTHYDLYFVRQGLLRFYYLSPDGKESNKAFVTEGQFAGALISAVQKQPLYYGIQALEPTTLLAAPLADFIALFDQDPAFERIGRKFTEYLLIRKEQRMRSLLEQTATERYEALLRARPDLVQRVPQYHLASFLGITEVSLSRLKQKTAVLNI